MTGSVHGVIDIRYTLLAAEFSLIALNELHILCCGSILRVLNLNCGVLICAESFRTGKDMDNPSTIA